MENSVHDACRANMEKADRALHAALDEIERLQALVDEQANDESLWFRAETCAEAYVQQALRRLHATIEGKSPEECARAVLKDTMP